MKLDETIIHNVLNEGAMTRTALKIDFDDGPVYYVFDGTDTNWLVYDIIELSKRMGYKFADKMSIARDIKNTKRKKMKEFIRNELLGGKDVSE